MEKWLKFHRIYIRTRIILRISFLAGILTILLGEVINQYIIKVTERHIHVSTNTISEPATVLVLGSAPGKNAFFINRMRAAYTLYQDNKARHFILSGDNHNVGYNEPEAMRQFLIQLGIPDSMITLDYAGFRTLDSVVRAKCVFGQNKLIIVSQRYHLSRALYLAKQHDIDCIGYCAINPSKTLMRNAQNREWLARVKAMIDVHICKTKPHFLGPAININ